MTIGLALSGGGSKGDFEVGAVRFLYDSGIRPSVIAGCSVGAINAAKLAEGEDPADATRGLPGLEAIWRSLETNSDMYTESAWLAGSPAEIKAAIEGQVPISALGPTTIPVAYFPDVSQIRQAFINLAYLTSTGKDILETLQSALTEATSLFTLEPIRAKLNADLDPAKVAAWSMQGNKLRLAMVALESGKLRYVTEEAALVERDGATAVMVQPGNTCSAERQAVAAAENALKNAQKQLFDPNANKQSELQNVRQASEALSQAQHALAACESSAPTAPAAVKTDFTTAVLASAAFPGFFPPVPIANETYVDGGVRALIPVDAAIRAGATEVYAVSASPIPPDPAGGQWLMLDIAWRAVGLLTSEIAFVDSTSSSADVPVHLIAPDLEIHGFDVVDSGLIQISRDYGYMRAADVVQKAVVDGDVWKTTNEIAAERLAIWSLENQCSGHPDPTHPAEGTPAANPALQAQINQSKQALATLIYTRKAANGAVPPDIFRWTMGTELHPWAAQAPAIPQDVGLISYGREANGNYATKATAPDLQWPWGGASFVAADVDGDGKAEVVQLWNSNGQLGMIIYGQEANGSYATKWASANMQQGWGGASFVAADVDGDGKAEVVQLWNSNGQLGMIIYGQEANGSYATKWASANMQQGWGGASFVAADVDGDGKAEVVQLWNSNGQLGMIIYGQEANGSYATKWASANMQQGWGGASFVAADVDGDGKAEVVQLWNSNGQLGMIIYGQEANGSYATKWASANMQQGWGGASFVAADVDGDGKAEVVQLWNSNGQLGMIIYGQEANGSYATKWASANMQQGWGGASFVAADVDGDGKAEVVQLWPVSVA